MNNLSGKRKPEDGLETEQILKKPKEKSEEEKETTKEPIKLSETISDEANVISVKDTVDETPGLVEEAAETVEGLDETPDFAEEPALPKKTVFVEEAAETVDETPVFAEEYALLKKTVFVARLPPETTISDIIDFFKDVGRVVRVRLQLTLEDQPLGASFVEFASANEAKKALEKKKGEYFHNQEIFLVVAHHGLRYFPPKYCIDHKVWYEEDYLQQESLPIEEDETPPDFVKEDAMKNRTLFVANLSPQTTKILHIQFFGDVAEVVSVRLIVNHEGKHVGYGFVEFASAYEAKRALEIKNGEYLHDHKILLMKGPDETPGFAEAVATVKNKTLFIARLARQTKISHIINFFKDVGEVVHVRLIVDPKIKHVSFGFVEFASAKEAEKALEKKNREYLHNHKIFLDVVKAAPYPLQSRHCIDHKVWYKDYPQRESLVVKEDAAAVEGLDETPDFVEEVASRENTVFVANLSLERDTLFYASKMSNFFKDVGKVVRVRLIADDRGEPVGCGFVEFASANEAKKAVQKRNGTATYVNFAEIAPYPFQPKYNLADLAEKLWYEDNLRREGFGLPNKLELEKHKASFCSKKQQVSFFDKKHRASFCGTKITFSDND